MTEVVADRLGTQVLAFPSTSLDALESVAMLQTRFDRKYVIAPGVVAAMLAELPNRLDALEIEGIRSFQYQTRYFDTPEHESYRGAVGLRRRRFKVRIREYLDQGSAVLEIKTKGGRGETVKMRRPYECGSGDGLDADERAFVDACTARSGLGNRVVPVLTTRYLRSTLVDRSDGSRTTIDVEVRCAGTNGRIAAFPDHVVVETKSIGTGTASDHWLWQHGHRPVRISKFGVGMAICHPELPSNRWHRVISRFVVAESAAERRGEEFARAEHRRFRVAGPRVGRVVFTVRLRSGSPAPSRRLKRNTSTAAVLAAPTGVEGAQGRNRPARSRRGTSVTSRRVPRAAP